MTQRTRVAVVVGCLVLLLFVAHLFAYVSMVRGSRAVLFQAVATAVAVFVLGVIVFRGKVELAAFTKTSAIVVIVFWSIALTMLPLYLPVTLFQKDTGQIDFFQVLKLLSIALFHSGTILAIVTALCLFKAARPPRKLVT